MIIIWQNLAFSKLGSITLLQTLHSNDMHKNLLLDLRSIQLR